MSDVVPNFFGPYDPPSEVHALLRIAGLYTMYSPNTDEFWVFRSGYPSMVAVDPHAPLEVWAATIAAFVASQPTR